MADSDYGEPASPSPDLNKLVHDLRGPVINIEGLTAEVSATVETLVEALHAAQGLSPDEHQRFCQLIETDLNPCLQFLTQSTAQLHQRLDSLTSLRS